MKRNHGFTLLELMISIGLLALLVGYATQAFVTSHRAYVVVDQVAEAQQNLRALSDLLEREAHEAGFMVPEAAAVCGIDNTNRPDLLYLSDALAIDPDVVLNAANADPRNELGIAIQAGYAGGAGSDTLSLSNQYVEQDAVTGNALPGATFFYDNNGDGIPDSDFRVGGGAIIVDRANPERGAACGRVFNLPNATTLVVDYSPDGGGSLGPVPPGGNPPELIVVPAHEYQVNATSQLLRDGMLLADGVEDLQLALFYDLDADGQVDSAPLEYPGAPLGAVYLSSGWDNRTLRELRVNLVLRTRAADRDLPSGQFQATENRVALGGTDGFRRRVVSATVRSRNVGRR